MSGTLGEMYCQKLKEKRIRELQKDLLRINDLLNKHWSQEERKALMILESLITDSLIKVEDVSVL